MLYLKITLMSARSGVQSNLRKNWIVTLAVEFVRGVCQCKIHYHSVFF